MKFNFVDQIVALVVGQRISTRKSLTLAEEYLADHFPSFPVMPGVLLLECMAQSAAWLVRASEDFAHSLIYLAGAKNVVYKSFMTPGRVLAMEVECKRLETSESEFVGVGLADGVQMVKARITMRHANVADRQPRLEAIDRELVAGARAQFALLGGEPFVLPAAT